MLNIKTDSRKVKEGDTFVAIKGYTVDGHDYIEQAIKNGAKKIICERGSYDVETIIVENTEEYLNKYLVDNISDSFKNIKFIGITGTNGKTTTAYLTSQMLTKLNMSNAYIGTIGYYVNSEFIYELPNTTPDILSLYNLILDAKEKNVKVIVMEVSSHSLSLGRVNGINFDICGFTNLTEDHLDYFKTMDKYYEAKKKLFSKKYANFAVVNIDDDYGLKLLESINIPYFTYSIYDKADYYAKNIEFKDCKQCFTLNNEEEMTVSMAGKFNVSNSLASIAVLKNLGIESSIIKDTLNKMAPVEGRFNTYNLNGIIIVIDYAHTPDGLKNILFACREICDKKLISVFGCGGNREVQKRSIMGEISTTYADVTIITSDNPRFEKREDIVKDILKGVTRDNYFIELDRSAAILKAVRLAREGDFIVLSGKGAENYIDENGVKIPYSDYAEVEKIRRELNE